MSNEDLVENMEVDVVVDRLRSKLVLTQTDDDKIRHCGPRRAQACKLLDIIQRKQDKAFNIFVEALRSTDQHHLANLLVREGKETRFNFKRT